MPEDKEKEVVEAVVKRMPRREEYLWIDEWQLKKFTHSMYRINSIDVTCSPTPERHSIIAMYCTGDDRYC